MAQVGVGLLAIGFGGFDQTIDLCAGRGAFGCVAEQPVFAADDERADGVLGAVVVDGQVSAFDVALQAAPVVGQVVHRLAQGGLSGDLRLGFVEPGFELVEHGLTALLAGAQAFITENEGV